MAGKMDGWMDGQGEDKGGEEEEEEERRRGEIQEFKWVWWDDLMGMLPSIFVPGGAHHRVAGSLGGKGRSTRREEGPLRSTTCWRTHQGTNA